MKHVFVINPRAGKIDRVNDITNQLKAYDGKLDYEIYVTQGRGDAARWVKEYLNTHDASETYRFYACGGDGTLHDVTNGVFGHDNAEVACYASGSGNDFIKNYGSGSKFTNLDNLINGKSQKIDLLKVGDKVCINILSLGFDGEVTFAMHNFKRWPLVSGPMAYQLGVLHCFLFKMSYNLKVTIDNEVVHDGKSLLVAVANGQTYGGGYHCAPEAILDDGLIDVCLVKKISRFKAAPLIKIYKNGEHVHSEKLKDLLIYKKCKTVRIQAPKPVAYQVDGEIFKTDDVSIELVPLACNFVVPAE